MKQQKTIEILKAIFPKVKGLQVALLYGSFARKDANPNSDIDIQFLVDENFQLEAFIAFLKGQFSSEIAFIQKVDLRNKMVVYFKEQPKLEFGICAEIGEIDRNYLGSEITEIENSILFTNEFWKEKMGVYLHEIVRNYQAEKTAIQVEKQVLNLVDKFVYEFENCSSLHRRSDGYQFYFFYNIALQLAVQLAHLAKNETKFNFLPKQFISKTLSTEEQKTFYDLRGSLFLPEANKIKRKLLTFFYASIETLVNAEKKEELKAFLEWIYERDYFWNFRDISLNNPKIKKGLIFRTSTLTLFQNEALFDMLIAEKKIKTVIDLRADRELKELPYTEIALSKFNYIHAPFDPWNQSIEFQNTHHKGTNIEIAYRFFGIECGESIQKSMLAILNENDASAIHCHAGKDRTGIVITLLHLLSEADLETVYLDYLATEMDTKKEYLTLIIELIDEKGGIVPYLVDCGLNEFQIEALRNKITHGN